MKLIESGPETPAPPLIIQANRKVRTVILAVGVIGMAAGAMLIHWLLPRVTQSLARQDPPSALRTLQIVVGLVFLSVVPLGAYLCWFGYRAVRWHQIPPPGTWVIRDTQVVTGPRAEQRGRIVVAAGGLLMAVGLFFSVYFPHRLGQVFQIRATRSTTPSAEQSTAR